MKQEFVTLPREVVEQAIDALYCTNSKEGSPTYNFELKAIKELRAALEQQPTTEKSLAVEKQLVGVVGWRNHIPNSVTVVHWTGLIPPVGTELYIGQQPQVEQEPVAWISPSALECSTRESEKVVKLTRKAQPEYDFTEPLYTHPQPHTNEKPIAEVIVSHVRSGLDGRYTAEVAGYERLSVGAELFVRPQPPALEQPQNHVPDVGNMVQAGWKLVPVEPNCSMVLAGERSLGQHDFLRLDSAYRAMLDAAPKPPTVKESLTVEQPQADQPAMTPIAQRKLDSLLAEGYTISGYSVYHEQKHQHGFVTGAGLVGWWNPGGMEYPQPQGEQEPVAEVTVSHVLPDLEGRCTAEIASRERLPVGAELFIHPQNLRCKSTQARLATLWGYVKEQSKRKPLTDEQLAELTKDGYYDSLLWSGVKRFARAIEAAHNIK